MLTLAIEKRDTTGKISRRREKGLIPAVLYGPKEPSTPITLRESEFVHVWNTVGESSVIELTGLGESKEALIHDIDLDPVSGQVRHADFYIIEKGKKIEVEIPLVFIGEAPAIKELGGTLVKVLHELTVEVMPKDLPHEITVDISKLVDFDIQIHVSDIAVPSSVTVLTDKNDVVALVAAVKEEEETPAVAPDLSSIEVEKKGKEEEATAPEENVS
ncbi:MAG TPA: 50S ribosomal protein L25 [Candidatus Paceibacterota bacterium]